MDGPPDTPTSLEECRSVADLIDEFVLLKNTRPDKSHNGDNGEREAHIQAEIEAEDRLLVALSYYGPVLWLGQVWWDRLPPRTFRINHTPFGGFAKELPWPPRPKEVKAQEPVEQPEEKVGGFISSQKY